MDTSDKIFFAVCITALIAVLVAIPFGNQKSIKVTCGKQVSLYDAFFYDLQAAGCPTITIKK